MEIARSIYLKKISRDTFHVNKNVSSTINGKMAYDRPLSDFPDPAAVEEEKAKKAERIATGEEERLAKASDWKMYKLATEHLEELKKNGPVKRRLVSLADANNLARRLAEGEVDMSAEKAKGRYYYQSVTNTESEGEDKSVLSLYLGNQMTGNLEEVGKKYTK